MPQPMMKCGHAANATLSDGRPACVICYGLSAGADEVDLNPPDLAGRRAKCADCDKTMPSGSDLPFFGHCPTQPLDRFYCGCFGWD